MYDVHIPYMEWAEMFIAYGLDFSGRGRRQISNVLLMVKLDKFFDF